MKIVVGIVACSCVFGFSPLVYQSTARTRLANVEVKGNARYTLQDIEALSGLQIGKPAAVTDLTDAANRLAKSGFFTNVKYTYTTSGQQLSVTFDVEEAPATVPVIFDNFVWLSDADLRAALRADVPEFDGKTTVYAGATDLISAGLQKVLTTHNLPGHVNVRPVFPITSQKADPTAFVFSVDNPSPKLCALHFTGTSAIPEKELAAQLSGAIGDAYSRGFMAAVSAGTLTDLYRAKGYWRAAFAEPTIALKECDGVALTLKVDEGAPYEWDRATWTGNSALPSAALDKVLDMKPGEPADQHKIDNGLRSIHQEYAKHGYVLETATYAPQLNDQTRRATFAFAVKEDAQFTMGSLEFVGIRDSDAAKLQKQWRLKSGDVFDEDYMKRYQTEVLGPLQGANGKRPVIGMAFDRDRHVVNLRVELR